MERMVESIRVPCPNAPHDCTARLTYHGRESHSRTCSRAPYGYPGDACSLIGSAEVVLDHFSTVHRWPCTKVSSGKKIEILLHNGFNFLAVDFGPRLLMLYVTRRLYSRSISVFCILPRTAGGHRSPSEEIECELNFSRFVDPNNLRNGDQLTEHYQRCKFRVGCTDLSNGLPNFGNCFQFVVHNCSLTEENKDAIKVGARIFIMS